MPEVLMQLNMIFGAQVMYSFVLLGYPVLENRLGLERRGLPIVNPDGIRHALTGRRWYGPVEHEIWATARTMVRALFWGGNKVVVLDSTNYHRRRWDSFIPSPDCTWKRQFVLFDTPVDVCKKRAEETYPVLCDVIDYFVEHWEPIDEQEEGKIIRRVTFNGG